MNQSSLRLAVMGAAVGLSGLTAAAFASTAGNTACRFDDQPTNLMGLHIDNNDAVVTGGEVVQQQQQAQTAENAGGEQQEQSGDAGNQQQQTAEAPADEQQA